MKRLAALVAAATAASVLVVLALSGYGSTEAAKPSATITAASLTDMGTCTLSSTVTWNGDKFLHKGGHLRTDLLDVTVLPYPRLAQTSSVIPAGSTGDTDTVNWGPQTTGRNYLITAIIFTGRGQGGADVGNVVDSRSSNIVNCP